MESFKNQIWIRRFTGDYRKTSKERIRRPLTTANHYKENNHLIKIAQHPCENKT